MFEGDLFEPLPATLRGWVDVLVANAPYVPSGAIKMMPPEALIYEPRVALDGGEDGLDVQRRVANSDELGATVVIGAWNHLTMNTTERRWDEYRRDIVAGIA